MLMDQVHDRSARPCWRGPSDEGRKQAVFPVGTPGSFFWPTLMWSDVVCSEHPNASSGRLSRIVLSAFHITGTAWTCSSSARSVDGSERPTRSIETSRPEQPTCAWRLEAPFRAMFPRVETERQTAEA